MRAARTALCAALTLWVVAGCSSIPNLDRGSAGCQNVAGIGPIPSPGAVMLDTANDVEFEPLLIGKSPREAAAIAQARGHTVVFNVQIEGFGECWCELPPEGTVASAWFNAHGALYIGVDASTSAIPRTISRSPGGVAEPIPDRRG